MKVDMAVAGLRNYRRVNAIGWHVVTANDYVGFFDVPLNDLLAMTEFGPDAQVVGIQGNAVVIEK